MGQVHHFRFGHVQVLWQKVRFPGKAQQKVLDSHEGRGSMGGRTCSMHHILSVGWAQVDPESQRRKMAEAKVVLGFAPSVYEWQTGRRYLLHEHPARSSWKLDEGWAICMDGGSSLTLDAHMIGLRAENEQGTSPAKVPTKWTSNAVNLLHLSVQCHGRHAHMWRLAGRYPPAIVARTRNSGSARRRHTSKSPAAWTCSPHLQLKDKHGARSWSRTRTSANPWTANSSDEARSKSWTISSLKGFGEKCHRLVQRETKSSDQVCLTSVDISRAEFNDHFKRDVLGELPLDAGQGRGRVGQLR